MEELLGLLGLSGGGLLTGAAYEKLGNLGDTAMDASRNIGEEAAGMSNFTGYGVTGGGVGSANVDANGNLSFEMAPAMGRQTNMFRDATAQMTGLATGDQSARQDDIYSRIRAMQAPEEERQRLSLENRLVNQGRLGVQTNMYGGTPEQFALDKAQAEARNTAAYQAVDQARAQQQQDASMANLFGQLQFSPLDQLRQNLAAGNQAYGYKDIASRQGSNIMAESLMGGLDAKLASRLGQANLMGELGSTLLGGAGGMFSSAINNGLDSLGQLGGNVWDAIFG